MSSKVKKSKHKSKSSDDDLSESKKEKKKIPGKDDDEDNINKKEKKEKKDKKDKKDKNDNKEDSDEKHKKGERKRKRYHTKISHKSKENNSDNLILDDISQKGKKVRFSNIDIIDVECWKQLNLKNTAEENLEELVKLTEGKKERVKNVSCCTII